MNSKLHLSPTKFNQCPNENRNVAEDDPMRTAPTGTEPIRHMFRWIWLIVFVSLGVGFLYRSLGADHAAGVTATPVSAESPRPSTKPIEEIRVGDRVLAHNPEVSASERAGWEEPDWNRWVCVHLHMARGHDSADIVLLRPNDWMLRRLHAAATKTQRKQSQRKLRLPAPQLRVENQPLYIEIDLPEISIKGEALVTKVDSDLVVREGHGRVVTATIRHRSSDVHELQLRNDRGAEWSIKTTGNHPFWSVDRGEFTQASTLRANERLTTLVGEVVEVQGLLPSPGHTTVFNIEVDFEHTYFVGEDGVLVHNVGGSVYEGMSDAMYMRTLRARAYPTPRRATRVRNPSPVAELSMQPKSARARLNRNLNGVVGDELDAHHLIPLEAINDPATAARIQAAARGGFRINGGSDNGVLLSELFHIDGHPMARRRMLAKIAQIDDSISDAAMAAKLRELAGAERRILQNAQTSRLAALAKGRPMRPMK